MARIVIALGGNALGNTPEEQIEKVVKTYEFLMERVANLEKEVEILRERINSAEIDEEGNVAIVQ